MKFATLLLTLVTFSIHSHAEDKTFDKQIHEVKATFIKEVINICSDVEKANQDEVRTRDDKAAINRRKALRNKLSQSFDTALNKLSEISDQSFFTVTTQDLNPPATTLSFVDVAKDAIDEARKSNQLGPQSVKWITTLFDIKAEQLRVAAQKWSDHRYDQRISLQTQSSYALP